MPRPRNPIGTAGNIRTYRRPGGGWIARSLVRDYDGVVRQVQKAGKSENAAKLALRVALRDRETTATGDLRPDDLIKTAAGAWFEEVSAAGTLALSTLDQYRRVIDVHITVGIGELRIRDLTVGATSRFLRTVEATHGGSKAKMVKSVLSGIAGYCSHRDALAHNPVRDTGCITVKRKPKRALDVDDVRALRWKLAQDPIAVRRDLPDLVDIMLATGVRISEAVAVRPDDLVLPHATLAVSGNIVRINGRGLIRQQVEDENSKLRVRVLKLPPWAVGMLHLRLDRMLAQGSFSDTGTEGPLFPAPKGGWRDPSNTAAHLRTAFDAAGYEWVTAHTFRRTVATTMDRTGLSPTAGAGQLGHRRPSMTQDHYHDRVFIDTGAAAALEAFGN